MEQDTDRAFIHQSFDYLLNAFPVGVPIILGIKPVDSITGITYLNSTDNEDGDQGDEITLDPLTYGFDPGRRHIYLKNGVNEDGERYAWPTALAEQNAVKVSIVAGYGAAATSVPVMIKQGILLLLHKHFYEFDSDKYEKAYEFLVQKILRSSYP